MATNRILIDGKSYLLASGNSLPKGATDWNVSLEPSQRGDPSQLRVASWRVDGPMGNSYEGAEGFLGVDYGDSVDTRWDGATLGPKINTVTLSTYDATTYVPTVRPVANHGTPGFTPSAGTNFENVDEAGADDDVTYNTASAAAADYFIMGSTGLSPLTPITKVTITLRARKTATGTSTQISLAYLHGTSGASSQKTFVDNTNYQDFTADFTAPFNDDAWTVETIENARWGYLRGASGDPIRVTQVSITVTATTPNTCTGDVAEGPNGERFLYLGRGRDVAKVDLQFMGLVNPGTIITLAADATSFLTTKTPAGTQEVSLAMEGANDYRVIATVAAAGTADTHSANDDGQDLRIIGQAPDRVAGFIGQSTLMNILSASNTMDTGNWQSTGVLSRRDIVPTGFAPLGKLYVIGTSDGPYTLNPDTALFEPVYDELGTSYENCRATIRWTPIGVLTGTISGLRYVNEYGSGTIGPENSPRNASPVSGWFTALAAHARWVFGALFNPRTRDTYLLAGRPQEEGDPPGTGDLAWFNLATFTDTRCDFLRNTDRDGGRFYPTLVGGYGSNLFWLSMGRSENWRDETSLYTTTSGYLYLTEMRRSLGMIKDLEAVEFTIHDERAGGVTLGNNLTVAFSIDDDAYQSLTAVNAVGLQRQVFATAGVPNSWATGRRIKPRLFFEAASSDFGPRLIGTLDLHYRERPVQMEVARFTLQLDSSLPEHGMEEQQQDLLALVDGAGPVLIPSNRDLDSDYWKICTVDIKTAASPAAGPTTVGDLRYAFVTAKRWPQASGD